MSEITALFLCLLATSICANNSDLRVRIEDVKYSNLPVKYDFVIPRAKDSVARDKSEDVDVVPKATSRMVRGNLNDFTDDVFANVKKIVINRGFDPVEMPDMHPGFKFVLVITLHGELDLTNGSIKGISTFRRRGNVNLKYNAATKFLTLSVPITIDVVRFQYDYNAKLMNLGPAGKVKGSAKNIKVLLKLGFDVEKFAVSLIKFDIKLAGDVSVRFRGNVLIDWMINILGRVISNGVKSIIPRMIEAVIKKGLTFVFDAINGLLGFLLSAPRIG